RRRHTRSTRDWSSDVCSSDLRLHRDAPLLLVHLVSLERLRPEFGRAVRVLAVDDDTVQLSHGRSFLHELVPEMIEIVESSATERSEERRGGKECTLGVSISTV